MLIKLANWPKTFIVQEKQRSYITSVFYTEDGSNWQRQPFVKMLVFLLHGERWTVVAYLITAP